MNFDKYTRAIELMNAVPGYSLDRLTLDAPKELVAETHTRWDDLYTFVFANFDCPVSYHELGEYNRVATWAHENEEARQDIIDLYELLRNQKQDEVLARLTAIPPEYRDSVFPVAIARYLLAYKQLKMQPNMLTTFKEFCSRYAVMVFEGANLKHRQPKAA